MLWPLRRSPESRACACSTPRRQAGQLACGLPSPALPPPVPIRRKSSRVIWCPCERGCAEPRGTGKPLQIAVDDVTGTTVAAQHPGGGLNRATNECQRVERVLDAPQGPLLVTLPAAAWRILWGCLPHPSPMMPHVCLLSGWLWVAPGHPLAVLRCCLAGAGSSLGWLVEYGFAMGDYRLRLMEQF